MQNFRIQISKAKIMAQKKAGINPAFQFILIIFLVLQLAVAAVASFSSFLLVP